MAIDEVRFGNGHLHGASRQCFGLQGTFGDFPNMMSSALPNSLCPRWYPARARIKCQGDPVHAVALSGRRRTVRKHVAQVSAAPRAMDFGPGHAEAVIDRRPDRIARRAPRSWAIRCRSRTWCPTRTIPDRSRRSGTSRPFFVIERTGAGALRAMPAEHLELLGRQRLAPFIFRFCRCLFSHASSLPNREPGTKVRRCGGSLTSSAGGRRRPGRGVKSGELQMTAPFTRQVNARRRCVGRLFCERRLPNRSDLRR